MGREIKIKPRQPKLFRIFNFDVSVFPQNVRIVVITIHMNQTVTISSLFWVDSTTVVDKDRLQNVTFCCNH